MDTAKRCPKCTNHFNFAVIKGKGHKHECPFVDCSCSNCLKTNQQNIKSRMKYKKAAQGGKNLFLKLIFTSSFVLHA